MKLIAFLYISNSKCTRAQLWNSQTGAIVLGNEINCFPLHIKFKVQGSSIMEFPGPMGQLFLAMKLIAFLYISNSKCKGAQLWNSQAPWDNCSWQ